jgi:hypothetical protein
VQNKLPARDIATLLGVFRVFDLNYPSAFFFPYKQRPIVILRESRLLFKSGRPKDQTHRPYASAPEQLMSQISRFPGFRSGRDFPPLRIPPMRDSRERNWKAEHHSVPTQSVGSPFRRKPTTTWSKRNGKQAMVNCITRTHLGRDRVARNTDTFVSSTLLFNPHLGLNGNARAILQSAPAVE